MTKKTSNKKPVVPRGEINTTGKVNIFDMLKLIGKKPSSPSLPPPEDKIKSEDVKDTGGEGKPPT